MFKARYFGPGGFERTVVVKRILPGNCEDPEFIRMFAAEARILGMLHHPNVVQAYDVGESDGTLFLVLEYVDGPSLGRLMRVLRSAARPLPPAFAGHFALEICRALDYVHTLRDSDGEPLNVIHRDVTPSNIVLTSTGSAKLLDFGIAKYDVLGGRDPTSDGQGQAGVPGARRRSRASRFDARIDLFSVGRRASRNVDAVPAVRRGPRAGGPAQGAGDADPARLPRRARTCRPRWTPSS